MDTPSPISLSSLYQAVKRRWRAALLIALVVFASGTTTVLLLDKHYTATATVLLAPGADQLADEDAKQGPAMTDPFFVHSETDIASADSLDRKSVV